MKETSIEAQVGELEGWSLQSDAIRRTFEFNGFTDAIAWTIRVAFLAEAHGHHPDIDIRYNRVTLALTTHDAGARVTQRDVDLARAIGALSGVPGPAPATREEP